MIAARCADSLALGGQPGPSMLRSVFGNAGWFLTPLAWLAWHLIKHSLPQGVTTATDDENDIWPSWWRSQIELEEHWRSRFRIETPYIGTALAALASSPNLLPLGENDVRLSLLGAKLTSTSEASLRLLAALAASAPAPMYTQVRTQLLLFAQDGPTEKMREIAIAALFLRPPRARQDAVQTAAILFKLAETESSSSKTDLLQCLGGTLEFYFASAACCADDVVGVFREACNLRPSTESGTPRELAWHLSTLPPLAQLKALLALRWCLDGKDVLERYSTEDDWLQNFASLILGVHFGHSGDHDELWFDLARSAEMKLLAWEVLFGAQPPVVRRLLAYGRGGVSVAEQVSAFLDVASLDRIALVVAIQRVFPLSAEFREGVCAWLRGRLSKHTPSEERRLLLRLIAEARDALLRTTPVLQGSSSS